MLLYNGSILVCSYYTVGQYGSLVHPPNMISCDMVFSYNALYAYGQSKLANALHASELTRRLQAEGVNITANSLHPGVIKTNLARHGGFFSIFVNTVHSFLKNVPQGAATTCYVALHPQVKGVSGQYFADSNLSKASGYARDPELAKKLWDFSVKLTESK
ncbi:putative very-long-chain 3-oxoacyl-CoA reductase [Helianthus anomalus]